MHGDIKGAFLSDTDATNISANNLVTNSDFASGIDGYIASSATLSHDSVNQNMDVTPTALYGGILYNVTPENGKKYIFGADVTPSVANMNIRVQIAGVGANQPTTMIYDGTATRRVYGTMVGDGNSKNLQIVSYSSINYNNTFTLDNVFFSELTELDRSVNNNGLQVFGTVTKSPVATGAELVAYSGFSNNSNYLLQPYNSDLDVGTGDISVIGWFKSSNSNGGYLFERLDPERTGNRLRGFVTSTQLQFLISASAGLAIPTSSSYTDGNWHFYSGVKRGSVQNYLNSAIGSRTEGT